MTRLATTSPGTAQGTILGTVHYMAPEQVEGKEADARSDMWALGAVLYEMLTGTRPFAGETPASVIGAILKDEPPRVSARQPVAPRALDHVVELCLAKEPDRRWQSAADLCRELEWIARASRDAVAPPASPRRRWVSLAGWPVAAASVVALGVVSARPPLAGPSAVPAEPVIFQVDPPPGSVFSGSFGSVPVPQLAVSPDGRHLVFVAEGPKGPAIWLRTLGEPDARLLTETDGAESPFWQPDSRSVTFFSQGFLKNKDITGGAPVEVVAKATVDSRGGAWGAAGTIVFSTQGNVGLLKTAAAGGMPEPVHPDDSTGMFLTARWPEFLPGGQRFLFQVRHADEERRGVYAGFIDGAPPRRIMGGDFSAKYAAGYLLFLRGRILMAQPFDAATLQLTGPPAMVAAQVAGGTTGYGAFSVSATGVRAYSSGLLAPAELRWVDRAGRATAPLAPAAEYIDLSLSPDNTRLAFSRADQQLQTPDVWVLDLDRGTESRVTSDPQTDTGAQWSPAGDQIIFRSNRESANLQLFRTRPDAGGKTEVLWSSEQQRRAHGGNPSNVLSTDWSPDGKFVIYHVSTGDAGYDLWALPLEGDAQPLAIARWPHNELQGAVSPDGRWIAYASDESGRYEIYVQAFPDPSTAPKTTVSTGGGIQPQWRGDGRELFYLRSDGTLMAVAVRTQGTFAPGAVTALFKTALPTTITGYRMDYVPSADGQRFVMKVPVENARPPSITVVLNWPALLQK
jgi:Tol biopolymer transport system component